MGWFGNTNNNTPMQRFDDVLAYEIAAEEAFRTVSYLDTTDNWTIGIGHLLGPKNEMQWQNVRWTEIQVMTVFLRDLNRAIDYTEKQFPVLGKLSPARQRVLISMMFNMGPNRFAGFVNTTAAVNRFDYRTAYIEMLDSKWAREDVPNRAHRLAEQWRMG